ncbi:MAG TPA: DUF763 domain-containing protein, partial [Steroidobacteraceae bacterium]|nr:DUF763 domain-containing protein [Steroidobacteraceae bacterium]
EGKNQGSIMNLADARADRNRRAGLELVHFGPDTTIGVLKKLRRDGSAARDLFADQLPIPPSIEAELARLPRLQMPAHHEVRASDVVLKRLHAALAAAADRGPQDFPDLLLTPGVGARTIAALALVAEVVHGAPSRFSDPARFSMAHGGKDGHPFPVPLMVFDETIRVLKSAVERAKLGNDERLAAIQRLDQHARAIEPFTRGPSFDEFVAAERNRAPEFGGRTVFGPSR